MRYRLAGLAGFLPAETSTRSLSAIRQRPSARRNRRCAVQGRMVTKKASVRSVRTRRYTRSSRGRTAKNIVQGFRSGLDRKMRPECRVDTVNHSASPSRREKRATSNPVLSKPVCRHRTSACSALRRRIAQSVVFNTFSSFAFPSCIAGEHLISCRCTLDVSARREIRHRTTVLILL